MFSDSDDSERRADDDSVDDANKDSDEAHDPETPLPAERGGVLDQDEAAIRSAVTGVAKGVRWTTISAFILRAGGFLSGILAARIIAPDQFGLFAVALIVYGVLQQLSGLGVPQALVREVHRTKLIAPTVNTISLGFSVVMAGVMVLCARPLATLLGEPGAAPALQVLSLSLIIGALGNVPAQILTRDYRQRERFFGDLSNFATSTVVLVLFALAGQGVMALAWSQCIGLAVSSTVLNLLCKERYGFGWNRAEAASLLRFALPLAGASVLTVVISDIDSITIARQLGATALGHYNLAFNIAAWPLGIFTSVLMNITVTTFARAQGNIAELREHVAAALAATAGVAFPLCAILAVLSHDLVGTIYGTRWLSAAPVLSVLSVLTAIRIVQLVFADLLVATGHTQAYFWFQIVWLVALIPAMICGVHFWGIVGAGYAHVAVAVCVVGPFLLIVVRAKTGIGLRWMGRLLLTPTAGALLALAITLCVSHFLSNMVFGLLIGGLIGAVSYAIICHRWLRVQLGRMRDQYTAG